VHLYSGLSSEETEQHWGGADVVVTTEQPHYEPGGFYPEPRTVVTPHAGQLSWLFYQLRDIFFDLYDGNSKIEMFGRLANAAVAYQDETGGQDKERDLLLVTLRESEFTMN
jgi:hypothetical protein